jgi:hypothetical protein
MFYNLLIDMTTQDYIKREEKYGAHNYHPLPVVLDRGEVFLSGMLKESVTLIFFLLTRR